MLTDDVKTYSSEEMKEYCKKHIDRYDVEPIVREAFYHELISESIAFIYLRIAQMEAGEERITGKQIAKEASVSPSVIVKYKNNPMIGITEKIFIQLLIKTHMKDMLDLWEQKNYNQALADYVNRYREMRITNGTSSNVAKETYELMHEKEITKDVCRKVYKELVNDRIRSFKGINAGNGVTDIIITVEIRRAGKRTIGEINWDATGEGKCHIIECEDDTLVRNAVGKMQSIIGGLFSSYSELNNVYLKRNTNRKIRLAMEYISLVNENVYLLR